MLTKTTQDEKLHQSRCMKVGKKGGDWLI